MKTYPHKTDIIKHVEECRNLKAQFKPRIPIKYLVVGESPPISGKYFYKAIKLEKDSPRIPAQVFRAIYQKNGVSKEEHELLLKDLAENKAFFLEDLSDFPINKYGSPERVNTIREALKEFPQRITKLSISTSAQKVLVLPKKTIHEMQKSQNISLWEALLNIIGITQNDVCIFSQLESYIKTNWQDL